MVPDGSLAAALFVGTGFLVALLGAYVRVERRVDLLANYDGETDPEYAAVHAGNAAVAAGLVTVGFGVYVALDGVSGGPLAAYTLVVTALAFLAAARAQGA